MSASAISHAGVRGTIVFGHKKFLSQVLDVWILFRHLAGGGSSYRRLSVQLTTACEARCKQCEYGQVGLERHTLHRDKIIEIIETAAKNRFQVISFTGGEPFLFTNELLEYITLAGRAGIRRIFTGTNGGFLQRLYKRYGDSVAYRDEVHVIAEALAATPLSNLWISIDSADPATHECNRQLEGVVKAIEIAVPILHDAGIYPTINLGINRLIDGPWSPWESAGFRDEEYFDRNAFLERYSQGFETYFKLVWDMGFTIVDFCYPMSIKGGPFGATSPFLTYYKPWEAKALFQALNDAVARNRWRFRIASPLCALYLLKNGGNGNGMALRPRPCSGGHDHFFVAAIDGLAYPCGYRNDALGEFTDLDFDRLRRTERTCTLCYWECSYNSDQLLSRLNIFQDPISVIKTFLGDTEFSRCLREDVAYFIACDSLHGRVPPRYKNLQRFRRW